MDDDHVEHSCGHPCSGCDVGIAEHTNWNCSCNKKYNHDCDSIHLCKKYSRYRF